MRRRELLAAVGLGGFGAVGTFWIYEPPALREVTIRNLTERTQTVDIRIAASGGATYERTHELAAHEDRQLSCDWAGAARTYEISTRLEDDSEWMEETISSAGDYCRLIEVTDDDLYTDPGADEAIILKTFNPCPPTPEIDLEWIGGTDCDIPRWSRPFRAL